MVLLLITARPKADESDVTYENEDEQHACAERCGVAIVLTIIGPPAPPTIAEHRMPANEPWCCEAEFNASENTMEYIIEMLNPIAGKAMRDISLLPNRADSSRTTVNIPDTCNRRLLSISFSRIHPTRQPLVISPQK